MSDKTRVAAVEKQLTRKTRDWETMIRIAHDFFHGWRKSVSAKHGEQAAKDMELAFWERIGVSTGERYLARGGKPDDYEQVAYTLLRASEVMGETAQMKKDGDATLLVHTACPWMDSYRANGIPNQCGAGCDHWFQTTVKTISPRLRVVAESRMPDGGKSCTRRFTLKDA